jgi:hypothetical protein
LTSSLDNSIAGVQDKIEGFRWGTLFLFTKPAGVKSVILARTKDHAISIIFHSVNIIGQKVL